MRTLTQNEMQKISGGEAMTLRIDGCYTSQQWREIQAQVGYEATRAGIAIGALVGGISGYAISRFSNAGIGAAGGLALGIVSGAYSYVRESQTSELWPWNY